MNNRACVCLGVAFSILGVAGMLRAGGPGSQKTAAAPTASASGPTSAPSTGLAGFVPVGLGGGGAMFAPASSPHDLNLMFVSCDMGGFYRSTDGGKSWTMLDFRMIRGSTTCRPVFHPTDPKIVYFDDKVSRDAGLTWQRLVRRDLGKITSMAVDPGDDRVLLIGTDKGAWTSRDAGETWQRCAGVQGAVAGMYIEPAGANEPGWTCLATALGIFRSTDGGRTFTEVQKALPWVQIRSLAGGRTAGERGQITGGSRQGDKETRGQGAMAGKGSGFGVQGSGSSGQGDRETGRPGAATTTAAAGADRRTRSAGSILYCTIPSRKGKDGRFDGGIYRSVDGGKTWQNAMGPGLDVQVHAGARGGPAVMAQYSQLGVAGSDGYVVYVVCRGTGPLSPQVDTIYRSDDAGMNWRRVYRPDPRGPQCNVQHGWLGLTFGWTWGGLASPNGFTVNPAAPDVAMVTNSGELFVTTDGGKAWRQAFSRYAAGQEPPTYQHAGRWESIGLEVTTTWNYDIDPFDPKRHYICYTDIGFALSEDGGATWHNNSRSGGAAWTNTTYMLAFDPKVEGKAWAAMSNVHDIPHWTYIHDKVRGPGGVCVSTDHCRTWKTASAGLPEAPCTSIALDLTSPIEARVLYVTMFGEGLYRSVDGGKTWESKSAGLPEDNRHVFLVRRHPDGTLYACVTGLRRDLKFTALGGLYRSRDGGESWQNVTSSQPLHWPVGFDFDPADSKVIYLAAATIPSGREGGLYKTTDGGATWRRLLKDEDFVGHGGSDYVQAMFVTVDPRRGGSVYLGTESQGLWHSADAGATWKPFEGIPFGAIQRVAFDPQDADRIYVTTFGGGVWRGSVDKGTNAPG